MSADKIGNPESFSLEPYSRRIDKPWGYEILLSPPDAPYTSKLIHVQAGKRLSLQIHDIKVETQTLVGGRCPRVTMSSTRPRTILIAPKMAEIMAPGYPRVGRAYSHNRAAGAYSHSIVPGGFEVMSNTTRPTGRISLIIREAIRSSRS